jgi:hypothetical protein
MNNKLRFLDSNSKFNPQKNDWKYTNKKNQTPLFNKYRLLIFVYDFLFSIKNYLNFLIVKIIIKIEVYERYYLSSIFFCYLVI